MALTAAPVVLIAALLCAPLGRALFLPPPPATAGGFSNTPFPPEKSQAKPAFHVQLGSNITLQEPGWLQIRGFTGLKPGHFSRGTPSFNTFSGVFTAPQSGVYQLTAQVHFSRPHLQRLDIDLESYVTVAICINASDESGDCQENASLESSSSISSKRFSAVTTGMLDLVAGQTVAVMVFSSSANDWRMVIEESSSFMGHYVQD